MTEDPNAFTKQLCIMVDYLNGFYDLGMTNLQRAEAVTGLYCQFMATVHAASNNAKAQQKIAIDWERFFVFVNNSSPPEG